MKMRRMGLDTLRPGEQCVLRQIRLLPRLSSRKRRQKRALTAPWQKPPPLRMPPVPQRKM